MVWLANPERYGQMQYRYCGKSGLRLPALSLGLWHNFGHVNALESQRAILRKAFDLGITHFDLANNYGPPPGSAEENFGRLLREWKIPLLIHQPSYNLLNRWVDKSGLLDTLQNNGVGCIAFTPLAQGLLTGKYLNGIPQDSRMHREGNKVRGLTPKMLTEANLNSLRLLHEMAQQRGQSMAQMALSWLLKDERVTSVLIGASRAEQLEENVQALNNLTFSTDELAQIDQHIADGELNLWQASSDK
ncbi:aldo/keto reductase [Escherichia coli]|nr:aldo/keto reductase [Escherichia coli]